MELCLRLVCRPCLKDGCLQTRMEMVREALVLFNQLDIHIYSIRCFFLNKYFCEYNVSK